MIATVPSVEKLSSVLVIDDITSYGPTKVYAAESQGLTILVLMDKRSLLESVPYRWLGYNFCSHEHAFHLEVFPIVPRHLVLPRSGSSKDFSGQRDRSIARPHDPAD
jgi:hypothetical protein